MSSKSKTKASNSLNFIEKEFDKIINKGKELKVDILSLPSLKSLQALQHDDKPRQDKRVNFKTISIVIVICVLFVANFQLFQDGFIRTWFWYKGLRHYGDLRCAIRMPASLQNAFMPQFDCSVCQQLQSLPKVANITPQEFSSAYAYSGRPVVIRDAMQNWTARDAFSFDYFKEIYPQHSPALDNYESDCQFFPYKTSFRNLREVLNMNKSRALRQEGSEPWYIGWSNCDPLVANVLRQHYQRPYFLPEDSEMTAMDWIFMGTPGYGAHMHIDHVGKPSWQAQIRGRKLWRLEPAPECYGICKNLEAIVEPGEIIVLDTNRWYHQTLIIGVDISITIGAEYD